jgi:hypothetical protein
MTSDLTPENSLFLLSLFFEDSLQNKYHLFFNPLFLKICSLRGRLYIGIVVYGKGILNSSYREGDQEGSLTLLSLPTLTRLFLAF